MKNLGTINGGIVGMPPIAGGKGIPVVRMNDAAIASNMTTLQSELEKRDPVVREPLTSLTYTRDIPIRTGGGWVDTISALSSDYGVSGGSGDALVSSGNSNSPAVIQANFDEDKFTAHVFEIIMRIRFVDMQRGNLIGRPLEKLLTDGVRMSYDKHNEGNVYVGLPDYGTFGLLNNPDITAASVSAGASGQTAFRSKTPDEILLDINNLIISTWAQAEYDLSALPNHIIMPYEQYNYIATQKVSPIAEKTILTFIMENNVATQNGGDLFMGATRYCKGAGTGSTDRMACYVHNDRFIAMEELVPMSRVMTQPNVTFSSYDSLYVANVSQVEFFYNQTMRYADGI